MKVNSEFKTTYFFDHSYLQPQKFNLILNCWFYHLFRKSPNVGCLKMSLSFIFFCSQEFSCLQDHYTSLESECRMAIKNFTREESEDVRMNKVLMKACSPMLKRYCQVSDNIIIIIILIIMTTTILKKFYTGL